jgi:hypothetical protein
MSKRQLGEFHQDVHVAVRPGFVARHRTKQGERSHPESGDDVISMRGQQLEHISTAHGEIIAVPSREREGLVPADAD